jgi:hypothetical protein
MFPWSFGRRRPLARLTVADDVYAAGTTKHPDVRACMAVSDRDANAVRELLRLQASVEQELKAQESLRTQLLEHTEFVLQSQVAWATVEPWPDDDARSATTIFSSEYFPLFGDWLFQLERVVRRVDDEIHNLKACLRLVNRRVQTILGRCRLPRFLRGAVVVESRFYMVHGNHPPRDPGVELWNPINSPGVWAVA